jgi:outer membrane lipopolysaccharide assembly protein LptE/RlpB
LLILGFAAASASCGWVLRGTQIEGTIAVSQLQYESSVSAGLSRSLNRRFDVNTKEIHQYVVSILNESQSERVQSLTAGLRSNQLRMEKRVEYRITTIDSELVEVGTALVWRDLDMDEFTPGATEREKTLLQEEIDQEIVYQILSHLELFEINHAAQS